MRTVAIPPETRMFVLTGAGISAESGVRTFRDANGLWEQHRIEDVASPEGWAKDPVLVWRFYSERRQQAAEVHPNPAHLALAALEKKIGEDFFLCTQNIDPLHELAGSTRVFHMHGELFQSRCETCDRPPIADRGTYFSAAEIPRCVCGARMRPHICWFGEMPFLMPDIQRGIRRCHLFVCVGSSGVVYPAAGFVREMSYRRDMGERVRSIYVGLERPDNAEAFDEVVLGKAGETLPTLFEVTS